MWDDVSGGASNAGLLDTFGWIGGTIADRYRIESVAGAGGYSTVYRAFDERLQRPVAVKCLECRRNASIDSFRVEAQRLYDLGARAEGVVHVLDFGEATSPAGVWTPYIALEWLDGETLRSRLDQHGAMHLDDAIELLGTAARSLEAVHAAGIVHRDLKPENLFLVAGGRIKLLDFGVAKTLAEGASTNLHVATTGAPASATWEYAAPEQFDKSIGATGPWTDVHALALILIEMATGRRAYSSRTWPELAAEATSAVRPALAGASPGVQRALAEALAKDTRARFQSVRAFWDALTIATKRPPIAASEDVAPRTRTPELLPVAAPATTTGPQTWGPPPSAVAAAATAPALRPAAASSRRTRVIVAGALVALVAATLSVRSLTRSRPGTIAVPAGAVKGVGTIAAFEVGKLEDEATFMDAMRACLAREQAVCTETQWNAACAVEPAIAADAAWTATYGPDNRLLVAGGDSCKSRAPARGIETHRYRCCTRAVAIDGANASTARRVLAYERAGNAQDADALADLFASSIDRYHFLPIRKDVPVTRQKCDPQRPTGSRSSQTSGAFMSAAR